MGKESSLTEVVRQSQCVFKGVRFNVQAMQISGKRKEFVAHPGAVVILPILDEEHIVMIRNYRFAVGKELWELPAGTLEPGELPEETAARELVEETGYQADSIQFLTEFFTSPGICNERMYAYVAKGLHFIGQHLDDTEQIVVEVLKWDQIWRMIREGIICDAKTLTTLLFFTSEQTKTG